MKEKDNGYFEELGEISLEAWERVKKFKSEPRANILATNSGVFDDYGGERGELPDEILLAGLSAKNVTPKSKTK